MPNKLSKYGTLSGEIRDSMSNRGRAGELSFNTGSFRNSLGCGSLEGRGREITQLDGPYSVTYYREGEELETTGEAIAVLRGAEVVGSDPWGGVFEGRLEQLDREPGLYLRLKLVVPPWGCLVTGVCAGSEGAEVEISGKVGLDDPELAASLDVDGGRVEVKLRYIGVLPAKMVRLRKS